MEIWLLWFSALMIGLSLGFTLGYILGSIITHKLFIKH